MNKIVKIGPFSGINNVQKSNSSVFQVSEGKPIAIVVANDVDLDDGGYPSNRLPKKELINLTSGLSGINFSDSLIIQDAGELVQYNSNTNSKTTLVSGIVPERLSLYKHAGQLFWTDGIKCGRLDRDLNSLNWGMDLCPTPTLSAAYGALNPGEYLVAGEYIDSSNVIHASDTSGSITLSSTSGIQVDFSSLDPDAEYIRLYLAGPNDDVLYLLSDVPLNYFPYTINSLPQEDTTCWSIGLNPPIPCDFIFSYNDRLMLVEDKWIYPSVGAAHHLYDIGTTTIARPETILAAGGLPEGFWTVSSKGAYWSSGEQIENWRTIDRKEIVEFCAGSLVINTADLPALGLDPTKIEQVVLFWCTWGLAIGLPNGSMIFPTRDNYNMDVTDKTVRFAFHNQEDLKQLIVVVS